MKPRGLETGTEEVGAFSEAPRVKNRHEKSWGLKTGTNEVGAFNEAPRVKTPTRKTLELSVKPGGGRGV